MRCVAALSVAALIAAGLLLRRRRRRQATAALLASPHTGGVAYLAAAYREATLTPSDAVEHCLAAIAALDGTVGAFEQVYAEEAREQARAATAALRSSSALPLFHGIPFALKDLVDVEGRVTTAGSAARRRHVATRTATVARRLLANGGILLGKVKTVEFAAGAWGINPRMGSPRNPWDAAVHRVAGGSSSGSGAAVGARLVPCALGTDTGGSVRLPAAFCGVVGVKTTEGLLPLDGVTPLSHTLDTAGALAVCVADAALMLDAMLPPRLAARARHLAAAAEGAARGVAGLRLAVAGEADRRALADARLLRAYDAALGRLRAAGAALAPLELSLVSLAASNGLICFAEGYCHHKSLVDDAAAPLDESVRARLREAGHAPAHAYVEAMLGRRPAAERFLAELDGCAALLLPAAPMLPPPLEQVDPASACSLFTRAANYLGLCAVSVPTRLTAPTEDEPALPTAVQVICRPNDEATAIRVAAAVEAACGLEGALPPLAYPPLRARSR
ncbi:hypothetical protein AB1Y20_003857 [Prymnesium parvum]|uniref:Amidase domain-containing protein n=1 Tax=Prymnesium parvum TaxID=97485 RepID=A0AB34J881_PRYPA